MKTVRIVPKVMKENIPKAMREQVWIQHIGKKYSSKCFIHWCQNEMDVFNFHVGHNIPESKGGELTLENLRPICVRCNLSMGNKYTIDEWQKLSKPKGITWWKKICFNPQS